MAKMIQFRTVKHLQYFLKELAGLVFLFFHYCFSSIIIINKYFCIFTSLNILFSFPSTFKSSNLMYVKVYKPCGQIRVLALNASFFYCIKVPEWCNFCLAGSQDSILKETFYFVIYIYNDQLFYIEIHSCVHILVSRPLHPTREFPVVQMNTIFFFYPVFLMCIFLMKY